LEKLGVKFFFFNHRLAVKWLNFRCPLSPSLPCFPLLTIIAPPSYLPRSPGNFVLFFFTERRSTAAVLFCIFIIVMFSRVPPPTSISFAAIREGRIAVLPPFEGFPLRPFLLKRPDPPPPPQPELLPPALQVPTPTL